MLEASQRAQDVIIWQSKMEGRLPVLSRSGERDQHARANGTVFSDPDTFAKLYHVSFLIAAYSNEWC